MTLYNINQYPVLGGNWHVGHQIGKGSSSIVRMGWDIKLQNHVALKYINEDAGWERKREGSIIKYKSIYNSPFLISPLGIIISNGSNNYTIYTSNKKCIVYEDKHDEGLDSEFVGDIDNEVFVIIMELQYSDIRYLISPENIISLDSISKYFFSILNGVNELHNLGILHRDIKPENLFLTNESDEYLKIGDFGLSRKISPKKKLTPQMVTIWYRCPELLLNETKYSVGVDIYSIALCVIELMSGAPLLKGVSEIHQLDLIKQHLGDERYDMQQNHNSSERFQNQRVRNIFEIISKKYSNICKDEVNIMYELSDLLARMLSWCPENRPSSLDALGHPYFSFVENKNYLEPVSSDI